jgi:hydrogenase/urease accessory protein HupE
MMRTLWVAAAILLAILARAAGAHEVRPAFIQITERPNGHYEVLWKQPSAGQLAVRLLPHLSGGALERAPDTIEAAPNFQIKLWRDVDPGPGGIDGQTLTIEGLSQTITDVLVSISLVNGDNVQDILRPQNPAMELHLHKTGLAVPSYAELGVQHILTGVDHLSFVLGLMLLVRKRSTLIKTITAFTVAHSITLAATALHLITVRPALIEALVAFSILFVAVEVVHSYRGRPGLTVRYPWLIAFTFGLLHGSAFAGALSEIGLPPNAIPLSLLLFNVGVELGQLMFVAVVLAITWMLSRIPKYIPTWGYWIPPYANGSFAGYVFLERLETALT